MPSQPDPNTVVSIVVPLRDDADILDAFLRETAGILAGSFAFHEIILVDDGSTDGTTAQVERLLKELDRVRYLRLSRSFGRDVAVCAGLESSIGDFVVVMDPNTDPPALVPDLVARCRLEGGVLHGIDGSPGHRGALREAAGGWFRGYVGRQLGITLHRGSTDFRVLSRQAVNSLLQVGGRELYLRVFASGLGFRQQTFPYTPLDRRGRPRRLPLGEELTAAIDILTLHTRHPLRVVSLLGLAVAAVNLLYMGYVVAIYLLKPDVAAGWTPTSMQLSGMFFCLFLLLAVLSEYVGSLLGQVRERPAYFIAEEKNSSVLLEDSVKSSVVKESRPAGAEG